MANSRTFGATGSRQSWVVPANFGGTTLTLEAWGAGGGQDLPDFPNWQGGRGGRIVGQLPVAPGDILYFDVGMVGQYQGPNPAYVGAGGRGSKIAGEQWRDSYSGGGATTVYKNGTALANRVAVAGGGGGAGGVGWTSPDGNPLSGGNGGHGGGTTGQNGVPGDQPVAATGGSQTTAGHGGDGSIGGGDANGANGGYGGGRPDSNYIGGGGGGGGYFGGGGGASAHFADHVAGGGAGGSSYVGGLTGTITNTQGYTGAKYNGKLVLTYDLVPNAPTLVAPFNNWNVDYTQPLTLHWGFSDPDAGDVQTRADIRWRVGSAAWTEIDNASTGTTTTYVMPANTWAAYSGQAVEWQVRTYDASGAGPWGPSWFFSVWPTPPLFEYLDTPTITSPTPSVHGQRVDGGTSAAYRARVVNDVAGAPGTTILADTGEVWLPDNPQPVDFTFFLPEVAYVNGTSYHILTLIESPVWVPSAFVDSGPLVANVNAPLVPTLVLGAFDESGSVQITVTNPGSDPNPPAYNRLYRSDTTTGIEVLIRDRMALNSTYTDWTCGFNRPYRYRAEAVTASGAITSST